MWQDPDQLGASGETLTCGDISLRILQDQGRTRLHLDGSVMDGLPDLQAGWHIVPLRPGERLQLRPASPDLPVLLRTSRSLSLTPGSSFATVVRVPLWIRIGVASSQDQRVGMQEVVDLPSRRLKRTWFGPSDGGEVAYSWWFDPEDTPQVHDHYFLVPITILNQSQAVLRFERMLLRAIHLDLFIVGGRLESNRVSIAFKGTDQLSHITFETEQAVTARGGRFVSPHRVDANQDIIRRSFHWLRDL